ncbi:unnamed protein product [Brachionus calyciflorus]|uniref:rhomboid protease n=1 Tax=Brachionus calyciflorus TaxID=104777 RepID=A0A813SYJ6_9BILA|nr:unnamed protein product [Brachionus calyciflorus]
MLSSKRLFHFLNKTAINNSFAFKLYPESIKSNLKNIAKNLETRNFNSRSKFSPQNFSTPFNNNSFIWKSGLFTLAFTGTCYSIAVISNYERVKYKKLFSTNGYPKFSEYRQKFNNFWNSLPDVKKAVVGIVFLNVMVFLAWRIPAFQNALHKYFLLSPTSGLNSQMVFSMFSHQQLFHILFNMVALYSMSDLISRILPMEQFLAYYLSSGVFASFVSSLAKILTHSHNSFSLGASGAIVSCFALSSLVFPDSKFYVFPIPFELEAQTLLMLLVAFDLGMLLSGSRRMDHAAHLGGALYGLLFFNYGPSIINNFQSFVIKKWKNLRSSKS